MTNFAHFIRELQKEITVDRKKIRDFGIVMFTVVGLIIPAFLSWRADWIITDWMTRLFIFGSLFLAVCVILPKPMQPVYRAWMTLAILLGLVMTKVIISLVFYLMMVPIGLIRQLVTGDPLKQKADPDAETYWVKKEQESDPAQYEKQY